MRQFCAVFSLLFLISCAGVRVPFTESQLFSWLIALDHLETNVRCTDLKTLNVVAGLLEHQHLAYIRSKDEQEAIVAGDLLVALGSQCQPRFVKLSVPEIKNELFGDVQTISDSSKLRELGGMAFDYRDVLIMGGLEATLHISKDSTGPEHRLVAIYRLADDKVIHFNYSGTDNVDRKSRTWPLEEFLETAIGVGTSAAVPGL